MTPKEKAEELIEKYLNMNDGLIKEFIPIPIEGARQCALVAVDEVLDDYEQFPYKVQFGKDYWNEVKKEIEKL
jgi:hypothetical protein